ncbi:uncharacterized protein LACBIDRAFT_321330 [Laccaria bicolor S238N-H82]|uniref:Predicted protein n=1 Tax=Laccaria bicolor (strain S238N-H82 / ATCC MYA-4686) TaxID=486041 RepID=B0CPM0_LACBS|nr:uncharacterized protein LACBIDRAFT_321330 [Laccaria bicolor S238N-H82]EDR16115.1 predicted protein [Laccaria bicolor S238N-H82]|eukprot:XP_001874323.1 predicted protein [Laccaria bicolor S238N-H82]
MFHLVQNSQGYEPITGEESAQKWGSQTRSKALIFYATVSMTWPSNIYIFVVHGGTKDGLLICAVALYRHEQETAVNRKPLSLRKVCKKIEDEHWSETKRTVKLDPCTLRRLVKGGTLKSIWNFQKSWLLEWEATMVIDYAIEVASRGFPLSHRQLKDHVDSICCARLGRKFPASGVGKNWTSCFISKHSDRLSTYWTHNLDEKWGWAVNPHTNKEWFDLLEDVLKGNRDDKFDKFDPPPTSVGNRDDKFDPPPTSAGSSGQADDVDDDSDMPALIRDPPPTRSSGQADEVNDDMPALASLEKDTYGDDGVDEDEDGGHTLSL